MTDKSTQTNVIDTHRRTWTVEIIAISRDQEGSERSVAKCPLLRSKRCQLIIVTLVQKPNAHLHSTTPNVANPNSPSRSAYLWPPKKPATPLQKSPSSFGEAGAGVSSGWMETCLRAGDCDAAV
mmetsp:Transcript_42320/g.92754  ORF Transcript_42320/g.92754 Transcript_42320/m.92754 type:complete len:124 (-) Transcript_42320:553-924(-)